VETLADFRVYISGDPKDADMLGAGENISIWRLFV